MVVHRSIPFSITADFNFGPLSSVHGSQSVVLCIDRIYAHYGLIVLTSLLTNTPSRDFKVVVLTHQVRSDQIETYKRLSERFNIPLRLLCIRSTDLERLDKNLWWTTSIYLRWLAPIVVDAPTILYLDADIIVEGDVTELFDCKSDKAIFGGVEDRLAGQLCRNSLGLPDDEPFLNTGVMLIDTEKWRDAQISPLCLDFARRYRSPFSSDQDILNVVGRKEKYLIPEKWNIQTFSHGYYELDRALANFDTVGIIHFSGEVKPWMSWADPLAQQMFRKYVDASRIPRDFWIEPRTIREQLLLAQVRERAGDVTSANSLRHLSIGSILAQTGLNVLFQPKGNHSVSRPDEPISDLLDREIVKAASPSLKADRVLSSCIEEPHSFWDSLRASRTIPLSRMNGDVYLPTRYSDIKSIVERPEVFSSRQILVGPGASAFTPSFPPFTSDLPDHTAHRAFLAPIFSARHTAKFRAIADRTVEPIIERLVGRQACEIVSEFSLPFVAASVGSLIGIPDPEMEAFRDEALAYMATAGDDAPQRHSRAAPLNRRFGRLLLQRIAEPSDDVASAILSVRHNGQVIDDAMAALLLRVLLEAGVETTAGVISFAARHFADRQNRAALAQPTFQWKRAVEEFLRLASPAVLARRSTSTTTVGGCPIANDSAVLLPFAAANRDPDVFLDPHIAKLDRLNNRHLAFGAGIHRCLGMHLARVLVTTGVKRWVESFPAYRLDADSQITWSTGPIRAISCLQVFIEDVLPMPGQITT